MPYVRRAAVILDQWRAVERALTEVPADSPESWELVAERARLRNAYQAEIAGARAAHRRVPIAFDEATRNKPRDQSTE